MSKIANNIRFLRQLKGLSQEQLADELKITRSRIGGYEEARNEPPIDLLIRLSEFFHIAIDALVRGDMRKTNIDGLMKIGKNRILFPILLDNDGNVKLPFLPTGKHRAFPIKGDSMPPIKEGSFVIAKFIERLEDIRLGHTYIVVTKEDGLTYKRVMAYHKKEGTYELHSDNKIYQPFKVKVSDILEIWEYTCSINMNEYQQDELNLDSIMNMLRGLKVEIAEIKKR